MSSGKGATQALLGSVVGVAIMAGCGYFVWTRGVVPAFEASLLMAGWPEVETELTEVDVYATFDDNGAPSGYGMSVKHRVPTPSGPVISDRLTMGWGVSISGNQAFSFRDHLHPGDKRKVRLNPRAPERTALYPGLGSSLATGFLWLGAWMGLLLLLASLHGAYGRRITWQRRSTGRYVPGPAAFVAISGGARQRIKALNTPWGSFWGALAFFTFSAGGLWLSAAGVIYASELTGTLPAWSWGVVYALSLLVAAPVMVRAILSLRSPRLSIQIDDPRPTPGETLRVYWTFDRPPEEIDRLTFWLQVQHVWKEGSGENERTQEETLFKKAVFQKHGEELGARGEFELELPVFAPGQQKDSEVRWDLSADGVIANWPDLKKAWRMLKLP